MSSNQISFDVESKFNLLIFGWIELKETKVLISFMYAKCPYQDHKGLWSDLEAMPSESYSWIIVGDFNYIHEDGEWIGGPHIAHGEFGRASYRLWSHIIQVSKYVDYSF